MPATANRAIALGKPTQTLALDPNRLDPNPFSLSIYGDPSAEIDDLLPSIREHGILVAPGRGSRPEGRRPGRSFPDIGGWPVRGSGSDRGPLRGPPPAARRRAADARSWNTTASAARRSANSCAKPMPSRNSGDRRPAPAAWPTCSSRQAELIRFADSAECRNSDDRVTHEDFDGKLDHNGQPLRSGRGRTDAAIARHLGMGGKDLYRQARAIWRLARSGDARARSGVAQLDAGTKTIHAAYKDLRRRDRFGVRFPPDAV